MTKTTQNRGYRLVKLDRRMAGHDIFTHRVVFSNILFDGYNRAQSIMLEHRNWCWESFGPGMELDILYLLKRRPLSYGNYDLDWAWEYTGTRIAIYLKDSALTAWQLKFL